MGKYLTPLDGQLYFDGVTRLYGSWLDFLTLAGKYAQKYYLVLNLEGTEEPDPQSKQTLASYYKNDIRVLKLAREQDREHMEAYIIQIRNLQRELCLRGFPVNAETLDSFVYSFTLQSHGAPERRTWYRNRIRRELKRSEPNPLTLHQLEEGFQASGSYPGPPPE